jgi:hypothetical protein
LGVLVTVSPSQTRPRRPVSTVKEPLFWVAIGAVVAVAVATVLLVNREPADPTATLEGKAISGVSIQSRMVSHGDSIVRLDANALARAAPTEGPYRGTFRVDLRWSRWQIGSVAPGERETVALTLILKQACLPGPVDLARCTAYGTFTRAVPGGDGFQTLKLMGTLTLDPAASTTFLGTIDLDARADGGVANGQGHQRIRARFTPGEVEVLPWRCGSSPGRRRLVGPEGARVERNGAIGAAEHQHLIRRSTDARAVDIDTELLSNRTRVGACAIVSAALALACAPDPGETPDPTGGAAGSDGGAAILGKGRAARHRPGTSNAGADR